MRKTHGHHQITSQDPRCRPNAKLALGEKGAAFNYIYLRAFGNIDSGDEILFDYVRCRPTCSPYSRDAL